MNELTKEEWDAYILDFSVYGTAIMSIDDTGKCTPIPVHKWKETPWYCPVCNRTLEDCDCDPPKQDDDPGIGEPEQGVDS